MEASHASSALGDPLIGLTLDGRYSVRRRIGEGGMGIVYEAEHAIIQKRVALKVLRRDYSMRPDVVERFKQEAQSASRVDSPHIIDISDFGETPDGDSYFVMEFLEGEDLSNKIRAGQSLDAEFALKIAIQCCDALGAAHAAHIVHRDMKPENIFLTSKRGNSNFVKIVDFGIAKMNDVSAEAPTMKKLTKTGMIFGTPEYMSPEQAAGKPMDYRVDIYAMGIILYEMFAGTVPFLGETFMGVLTQHMFDSPPSMHETNPNAEFPPGIEPIILRCLQKDPDDRFQSMDELAHALRQCQNPEHADAKSGSTQMGWAGSPSSAPPRVPRMLSPEDARASEFPVLGTRSKVPLMVGALLLGGAVLIAGVWFWSQRARGGSPEVEVDENQSQDEIGANPTANDNAEQVIEGVEVSTDETVAEGVAAPSVMHALNLEIDGYRKSSAVVSSLDGQTIYKSCTESCTLRLKPGIYTVVFKAGRKAETRSVTIVDADVTESFVRGLGGKSGSTQSRNTAATTRGEKSEGAQTASGLSAEEARRIAREEIEKNKDYSSGGDLMNPEDELKKEEYKKLKDDKPVR